MPALTSEPVQVDSDVTGVSWSVSDLNELACLIAIIALGQVQHASQIILDLEPLRPAMSHSSLFNAARRQMQIAGQTDAQRDVAIYHRDGFLFECISWIEARQQNAENAFLKDPHITATMQGLDGLMIQMDAAGAAVATTTIFEDKCTDKPRDKFRDEVLPAFSDHHANKRSRELVATAVALIRESGLDGTAATVAAGRVLDTKLRVYRAALTVGSGLTTPAKRKALFKGYKNLTDLTQHQRLGATFPIQTELRAWFQGLADAVILALNDFEATDV